MAEKVQTPVTEGEADPYAEFSVDVPGGAAPEDPYGEFSAPASDAGGNFKAFGEGAARAASDTGLPLAGAAMGASIGALAGPLAPVAVPVGGLLGLGAGFVASRGVNEELGLRKPEDMPAEVRPFAYAGEAIGGAAPITGATVSLARSGIRAGRPFIDKILSYAAEHPVQFGIRETGASLTAGAAGAGSEVVRPGETLPRIAAEVLTPLVNPVRVVSAFMGSAVSTVKRMFQTMTPAGQETLAAQYLQRIVKEFGEDPEAVSHILAMKSPLTEELTAAQKSGSDALAALEQRLAQTSTKFGIDSERKAAAGMTATRNLIALLRGTGDPAALQAAGELQAGYFRTLLTGRIQSAEADAVDAARAITGDAPTARQALSTKAVEIVQSALDDARKVERSLWDKVPTDVPSTGGDVIAAVAKLKERMLPEESLPPLVEKFAARISGEAEASDARAAAEALFGGSPAVTGGGTTTGELKILRSLALDEAKGAEANSRFRDAKAWSDVADAALSDLNTAFEGTGNDAYDTARKFTFALHDTFTRTFANSASATTRSGAERVAPELLLRRALGTGREQGDLRLKELMDATRFPVNAAEVDALKAAGVDPGEALARVGRMADAQERLVRLAASETIDPQTQRVSVPKLSTFLRNNADVLQRFPAVQDTLENAVRTEAGAKDLERIYTGGQKVIDAEAAFSKVAAVDSPTDAVAKAVRGSDPETQLTRFIKMAKEGDRAASEAAGGAVVTDAQDGLRYALVQQAITRATKEGGLDFEEFNKILNEPMRDGLPSIVDMMRQHGLVDGGFRNRLNTIVEHAQRLTASQDPLARLKGAEVTASPAIDTLLRIVGSKLGGHVSAALGGGSTLIANSAGSKYLTEAFNKMGGKTAQALLIRAAEDPRFMAQLLRQPASPAEELRLAQSIHAYALQSGFIEAKQEVDRHTGEGGQPSSEAAPDEPEGRKLGVVLARHEGIPRATDVTTRPLSEKLPTPEANQPFPSAEEAHKATEVGFGRGTGLDGATQAVDASGEVGRISGIAERIKAAAPKDNPAAQEVFTRAALAANRSAIAALGFEPRVTALDGSPDKFTVGGFYSPSKDVIMAESKDPSTVVHESIHRGLRILKDAGALNGLTLPDEESVVRYLMATVMGDPEKNGGEVDAKQRSVALKTFNMPLMKAEYRDSLDKLEKIAAEFVAKRKPGGPT